MSCEEIRDRLDDYVDGDLAPDTAEMLERHLEGCDGCRKQERELRALLARASSLAGGVAPERDLWPEIRDRIESRSVPAFFGAGSWTPWRAAAAMAAAVLIVVTTAVVSYRFGQRSDVPLPPPIVVELAHGSPIGEDPFIEARNELRAWLEQHRESLPPETLERIEGNLQVIDESVDEIHTALEKNPESPELNRLLLATYRREVQLLQRVNAWYARM